MAYRFRSLAASAVLLVPVLAISPAPETFAHTGSSQLPVTLVISDICTLETSTPRPRVACEAGGQYRILSGEYFASLRINAARTIASRGGSVVEIAF
jgi:hypothetical protein